MVAIHFNPLEHILLLYDYEKLVGHVIFDEDPSFDWQVLPGYEWQVSNLKRSNRLKHALTCFINSMKKNGVVILFPVHARMISNG